MMYFQPMKITKIIVLYNTCIYCTSIVFFPTYEHDDNKFTNVLDHSNIAFLFTIDVTYSVGCFQFRPLLMLLKIQIHCAQKWI